MKCNKYTYILGLLILTGCQWNLDKVLFDGPCTKPSATIVPMATQLAVNFSLTAKTGDITTISWNFGDNTSDQTGEPVSHTYAAAGTYTVTATLNNRCNDNVKVTQSISVDQQIPPQIETLDASSIGTDKATLGIRFTSLGRSMTITEFGYCYSDTKALPEVTDNPKPLSGTASVGASFTSVLTGLTSGKAYTVRAYCKTDKTAPQYGAPKSFTTIQTVVDPVVETGGYESVTSTSAVLKMKLISYTSPPTMYRIGICYSKNPDPQPDYTNNSYVMFDPSPAPAIKEYSFNTSKDPLPTPIVPLDPNTTYYYRAFAVTNALDNVPNSGKLVKGAVSSFKTLATTANTFLPYTVIYAGNDNGKVYAYSSDGTTKIWEHQISTTTDASDPVASSIAYYNGKVYAATRNSKKVVAMYANTGAEAWTQPFVATGNITGSPTIAQLPAGNTNYMLYIGDTSGKLYFIDPLTGAKFLEANRTVGAISSSPAVSGGIVVVGSQDNNVYAFNSLTGAYMWSYSTKGPITSSPTIQDGVVYIGSSDNNLYAINLSNGTLKWQYPTGGKVDSSPTVVSGVVYVGSRDKYVYAVNTSGTIKWKSKTAAGNEIFSSPSVSNNLVAVGADDRKLYLFNQADGTLNVTFDDAANATSSTQAYVSSSPVFNDGTIYFGFGDYTTSTINTAQNKSAFYGIELNGKVIKMKFTQPTAYWSSPIVVNNGVIVGNYPSISGAVQ